MRTRWRRVAAVVAAMGVLDGCRLETPRSADSAHGTRTAAAMALRCGAPVIDSAGVGAMRIGATVDSVRARCDVQRDTIERRAEGMPVRVLRVVVAGHPVEAEVVDDRVWRITVEAPALRTADSIGVGTPLRQLVARFPAAVGDYGEGGIYMPALRCGLGVRLTSPPPGVTFTGGTAAALRALPESTVVTRVLVTGCGAHAGS